MHLSVQTLGGNTTSITDSNGNYQFSGVYLSNSNAPNNVSVTYFTSSRYWGAASNGWVQANSNTVINLILTPVCYGALTGSVFYADTKLPATNATVSFGEVFSSTDSNGNYSITNITLPENGAVLTGFVEAYAFGYNPTNAPASLTNCGDTVTAPPLFLPPIPKTTYGAVSGHVYDIQTGLPLAQAGMVFELYPYVYSVSTDTNGAYLITNMVTGGYSATASSQGYYGISTNVVLNAGITNVLDVSLLRMGSGYVVGTVRDSATGLPLSYVNVSISGYDTQTDSAGHYMSPPLPLFYPNAPTLETISVTTSGYYPGNATTTVSLGVTNVADLGLIKICTGATIAGNVVNALTQQPITNANVNAANAGAHTDANGNFLLTNVTVGNLNSPEEVTVYVSASGFISQNKSVTIFCNANITLDFGAPQTAFAIIEGVVTNVVTGLPLAGVFVGSQFGESAYTDTNGAYQLTEAPLGANNSSRTWNITAMPTNFPAQTLPVTVTSNSISTLDFGFGSPPTALIVTASGTLNPVTVGSNLLYLVTLTNTVADAQEVQVSDTLPPGVTFVSATFTNSPGTPFSAPIYSNNIVTAEAADFGSNSAVSLAILVTPTVAGTLTNIATVSSSTPDIDPTGSNHTATVITTIAPPAQADLALVLTENSASIVLGSNVTYTLLVTNLGPASAPDVVLDDTLPLGAAYVSSTTSQGTVTPNSGSVHWNFGALASQGFATATLVVTPSSAGTLTNSGTVTLVPQGFPVFDPNLANNAASIVAAVTTPITNTPPTALVLTAFGTPNPVTVGSNLLYFVTLTNSMANAQQVQLTDTLPPGVTFVTAAITNSGTPFSAPLYSNNVVTTEAAGFASNSTATLVIRVTPTVTGTLTNLATVTSATPDIDPTGSNLLASVTTSVTPPAVIVTNAPVQVLGPITFNPQTGLYQQSILFTNLSGVTDTAVRVAVLDLPSGVVLYNATGTNNGTPYVEYDQTVASGSGVVFLLEYYDATRQPFVSTNFLASVVPAQQPPVPNGTALTLDANGVFISQGRLTIEFATIPGKTYVVQYSTNAAPAQWQTAVPPIVATGTKTQWIDSGPPKTDSPPGTPGQRFYRVVQTN
jgi:uncharacterized repeat protein (TIGR01451 family)